MKVFTKNKIHNYGTLKLNGKNILEDASITDTVYLGSINSQ
jgi:hypothetical protein